MAGILSKIGDALRALTSKFSKTELRKSAVLSLAENNILGLKGLIEAYDQKVAQYIMLEFIKNESKSEAKNLRIHYKTFVSSLQGMALTVEHGGFLASIRELAAISIAEHQAIMDKFQEIFPGPESTVSVEDTKITQALVIGYLKSIEILLRWTMCIYSLVPNQGENSRVPGYRLMYLAEHTAQVAQVVMTILNRPKGRTILADIAAIKNGGSDVFLKAGEDTVEQYAQDGDYPATARAFLGGFSIAAVMIYIGDFFMSFSRWYSDYLVNMREWLVTKISILQMDMAKMDPNSPEYEKKKKVLEAYSAKLTEYDQKIAKRQGDG